ncbi:MAG: hypothetical protein GY771_07645, partial [bacterium]|nr:hypothetical protein [bacterium]
ISLISGHLGGANLLAEGLATAIGGTPVITTATDIAGRPCVEDIACTFHLAVEDPSRIKIVNWAILKGEKVVVVDADRERLKEMKELFGKTGPFTFKSKLIKKPDKNTPLVIISPKLEIKTFTSDTLILRPKVIIIGIGCRRGAKTTDIKTLIETALKDNGLSTLSIKNLATTDLKRDEEGLTLFADKMGLDIDYYTREELNIVDPPSGETKKALTTFGIRAVAEPAAMISAGVNKLCIKKVKSKTVTIAAAMAPLRL